MLALSMPFVHANLSCDRRALTALAMVIRIIEYRPTTTSNTASTTPILTILFYSPCDVLALTSE